MFYSILKQKYFTTDNTDRTKTYIVKVGNTLTRDFGFPLMK